MGHRFEQGELARVIADVSDRYSVTSVADRAGVKLKSAGSEWKACCPFHEDRSPSFTIFDGERRWHCFGCGASGDVLDFVQRAYRVNLVEAIDMLDGGALGILQARQPAERAKKDHTAFANRIVSESAPIAGTAAESYLLARGITMAPPPTLRFARIPPPKQPEDNGVLVANGPGPLPSLIAIVTDPAGTLVGIQRTYLTNDGRKAKTTDPKGKVKFSLGRVAGGAIHLGPPAASIVVTEGLEDGLTLAQALGRSVWVSAGTSMLPRMAMADITRAVVIGADGDAPGEAAANKAAQTFTAGGRNVRIMRPAPGYKDFNAELMGVRS